MKLPAGLRAGTQTLKAWWVIAPSRATASNPWTIRRTVNMGPLLLFDRAADRAPARATARMHLSVRTGKDCSYNARMLGIVLATVAFLAASFFIKRHLDGIGIPKRSEERRVGKECRSRCTPYPDN